MTAVVIGARARALTPEGRVFLSGQTLAEDFDLSVDVLEKADQIIWAYYARDARGQLDYDQTLTHTTSIVERLVKINRRIIFLSTDGVFSGAAGPYTETDAPDATTDYGRIKRAQEDIMRDYVRLRFTIFGPSYNKNRGLLLEMVASGRPMIDRPHQVFSPISTVTLNRVIDDMADHHDRPALFHLAGTALSKSDCIRRLRVAMALPALTMDTQDLSACNLALTSKTHCFDFDDEVTMALQSA